MANWNQRPNEPIVWQPDQQAFLEARRVRICRNCIGAAGNPAQFSALFPNILCPSCGDKGVRAYDYLTVIAGRRYGKSRFGSIAALEEACIPGTIGWACAPTNPKLHRYVIPAFERLIPPHWVKNWNSEFGDLYLVNGSLIHFQTLDDPDQGRGQGLDWLWIDEVCELTENHWDVISPSLDDRLGIAFFTTTPRGEDWVYERFYVPAADNVSGFWALKAKTSDNPKFQTTEGKARLAQKRASMSDLMYRQEYEADFVTFEGAIYGEEIQDVHILRSDDEIKRVIPEWPNIDPSRLALIGIDTGSDHPFGAVKIVSTEAGLVVVGEYLERDKSFKEHSMTLRMMAKPHNKVRWAINKNERQPAVELDQHGIKPIWKAENDQMAGIERVKSWLVANQLFFAASRVPKTIQQMRSYHFDKNTSPTDGQKRKERVFKKNDELPDCIRYALMTWPQLPAVTISRPPKRDLSGFPDEIRWSIERLRRIEEQEQKTEPDTPHSVGDFWLN